MIEELFNQNARCHAVGTAGVTHCRCIAHLLCQPHRRRAHRCIVATHDVRTKNSRQFCAKVCFAKFGEIVRGLTANQGFGIGYLRKGNVWRRSFVPMIKAAEVPLIRFHDLRHTHATMLLMAGENVKVVAERLGHLKIQITLDTYAHVFAEHATRRRRQAPTPVGLKLATYWLHLLRLFSNHKQKPQLTLRLAVRYQWTPSGQGRDRTADTRIFSPLLYQLSYLSGKHPSIAFAENFCRGCVIGPSQNGFAIWFSHSLERLAQQAPPSQWPPNPVPKHYSTLPNFLA